MIDEDFVNFVIGLVIILVIVGVYLVNTNDCSKKVCDNGASPVLTKEGCFCIKKAK